jgi:hypothetical protein
VGKVADFQVFRGFLDEAESLYGLKKTVAERIGIDAAHYTKVYKGEAYALNIENCLQLARLIARRPSDVLRAAGKGDLADLLDATYGETRYEPIPGGAKGAELLRRWAEFDDEQRDALLTVLRGMPKQPTEAPAPAAHKKAARTVRRA